MKEWSFKAVMSKKCIMTKDKRQNKTPTKLKKIAINIKIIKNKKKT